MLKNATQPKTTKSESIAKHFRGGKAKWQKPYDKLLAKVKKFGPVVSVAPTNTYLSLLRNDKKFAILQVTSDRFDIGIKLKDAKTTERFKAAGAWNAMVTHRVQISDPKQMDAEVYKWLKQAFNKAQ